MTFEKESERVEDGSRVMEIPGSAKLARLTNLEPATWYSVHVSAFNSAGETLASYKLATTTLSGGESFLTFRSRFFEPF